MPISVMKKKFIHICSLIILLGFGRVYAQTLQVVTKTIERTFAYKGNETLQLYAERSDIEINTWARNEVKVVIELSAKHPDRAIAEKDVEVLRYVAEKLGKVISLRNFVVLPTKSPKPESNLKARFVLLVPAACTVEIKNTFGRTTLKGLQKETRLYTEFCQAELRELKGKLALNTHFGSLQVIDFEGEINLTSERTDVVVRAIKGKGNIRTLFGSLDIQADKTVVKLDIETKNTELRNGTVANK